MAINMWDASSASSKTPTSKAPNKSRMPAKERGDTSATWNVDVDWNGGVINDFPIAYVLKHNSPWIYFEVLKVFGVIPTGMTAPDAAERKSEYGNKSLVRLFSDAFIAAVKKNLVPTNAALANAIPLINNLDIQFHDVAKNAVAEESLDFMGIIKREHPDLMARAPDGSPAFQAIRQRLLNELNQTNAIADNQDKVSKIQENGIQNRDGQIHGIIIGVLRALGLAPAYGVN